MELIKGIHRKKIKKVLTTFCKYDKLIIAKEIDE